MNIEIPADLDGFVKQLVSAGKFTDEKAVVQEALRLLRQREQLVADVEAGIAQAERGELVDGQEVFRRLEARAEAISRGENVGEP